MIAPTKSGKPIVITAVHDNNRQGATANHPAYGPFTEHIIATECRDKLASLLRAKGIEVLTDGAGTENWVLSRAAKLAEQGVIAVEIHCNAFSNSAVAGVETLSGAKDFRLGKALCEAISSALGIPNRGAKPENAGQHDSLAFVRAGGLVLELFFLSNPRDLERYLLNQDKVIQSIAEVIEAEYQRR